jgi:hypothetical protein
MSEREKRKQIIREFKQHLISRYGPQSTECVNIEIFKLINKKANIEYAVSIRKMTVVGPLASK